MSKKLIRRPPHVFEKDSNTNSKKQIEKNWVNTKQQERIAKGNIGMLDDIPKNFPAMTRSLKLQKRASENGFDWKKPNDTLKKIEEEKENPRRQEKEKNQARQEKGKRQENPKRQEKPNCF